MTIKTQNKTYAALILLLLGWSLSALSVSAAEQRLASPDGTLAVIVSDDHGLHFRVETEGKVLLTNSPLGLEFKDGTKLGPAAVITKTRTKKHDGQWENLFGNRRVVNDRWREMQLTLEEHGTPTAHVRFDFARLRRWHGISLRSAEKFRVGRVCSDR